MHILIAVSDIIDCAKVNEIAGKYNANPISPEDYKNEKLSAVILDLGDKLMVDIAKNLRSNAPVIGFYSHLKTELKEMADKAGWVAVPRSLLEKKLVELFNDFSEV